MEDVCLSGGFKVLLENSSGTDLQYPISEEGLKAAQDIAGILNSMYYLCLITEYSLTFLNQKPTVWHLYLITLILAAIAQKTRSETIDVHLNLNSALLLLILSQSGFSS